VALNLVESCEDDDERRVTTMGERKRMTSEEVVGYLLAGEGLDFLRESLSWVVQQLMEAEVSELIGAERSERSRSCLRRFRRGPLRTPQCLNRSSTSVV
jgi:transposase-like protein